MNKDGLPPLTPLAPITPFEPIRTSNFPKGRQWIGQVKWDGVRVLTYDDGERVRLFNRKHHERTVQYPELVDIHRYCQVHSVILDGEVIAFEDGKPSFHRVMRRDGVRKQSRVRIAQRNVPITYMIFDVLYVNGEWVTNQPLATRQSILADIIVEQPAVQIVQNQPDVTALYDAVSNHGLEGIVIKDLGSSYAINGKDKRWQKMKVMHDLYAVVGGVTHRQGRVNALLLGLYDQQGNLHYIGHAGTGKLTQADWHHMTEIATQLQQPDCPFVASPTRSSKETWMQPKLVVKVQYLEWTPNNTLRQPSIQAIVKMAAEDCQLDQ